MADSIGRARPALHRGRKSVGGLVAECLDRDGFAFVPASPEIARPLAEARDGVGRVGHEGVASPACRIAPVPPVRDVPLWLSLRIYLLVRRTCAQIPRSSQLRIS